MLWGTSKTTSLIIRNSTSIYKRSMAQKSMWERMKEDGWSYRRGRYYRPEQNRKSEGMSCDDAFEWYESIQHWLNGWKLHVIVWLVVWISQPTTTENKSIHLNSSDDGAIGKVDNSEHASGRNYSNSASLLLINNNSTEQSAGDGNNNNRKSIRMNRKWLTTCNECGHFRFARLNSKRVINLNFPYEHSARGGCTVPSEYHILYLGKS